MADTKQLDSYIARVRDVVNTIDSTQLLLLADAITQTAAAGRQILFIGNGGSAATASHYANDLVMAFARTGRSVRTQSLTDNSAIVTGIANDYSFEEVFEYQLRAIAQPGDLVVAISASGNSPNLLRAVSFAKDSGLNTAAIVGFDGGRLKTLANVVVHVVTDIGDYGPAEDAHLIVNHAVADLIRALGA